MTDDRWGVSVCSDCPFILHYDGAEGIGEVCGLPPDEDPLSEVNPLEAPPEWCRVRKGRVIVELEKEAKT